MKFNLTSLKDKLQHGKGSRRNRISPYRDWSAMFTVFAILMLITIGVHTALFMGIEQGKVFQADASSNDIQKKLNVKLLDQTTRFFDAKRSHFTKVLGVELGVASSTDLSPGSVKK